MTSRHRRNSLVASTVQLPFIEEPHPQPTVRDRRKSVSFFTSPTTPEPKSQPVAHPFIPFIIPTPAQVEYTSNSASKLREPTPTQVEYTSNSASKLREPVPVVVEPEPVKEGIKSLCARVSRNEKRLDEVKSCQCDTVEAKFKSDIEQLKKEHDITFKKLFEEITSLQRELKDLIDN
jgi:hypothetical protein